MNIEVEDSAKSKNSARRLLRNPSVAVILCSLLFYGIYCAAFVINEKLIVPNRKTTEQTIQKPTIAVVQTNNTTAAQPISTSTPQTTTQQTNTTSSSYIVDEYTAKVKDLERCISIQNNEWATFKTREKQADDYIDKWYNDSYASYNAGLISRIEFNSFMTETYNFANQKKRTAHQLYFDTVIGQKCTNTQNMPPLTYWKYF